MTRKTLFSVATLTLLGLAVLAWTLPRRSATDMEHHGALAIQSINALAFGPDNVLFVGDTYGATVFAIDVKDERVDEDATPINIENLDKKIAALLGTTTADIHIGDMAVHPTSQHVYLSVTRGSGQRGWGRIRGNDMAPVLLHLRKDGTIDEVALDDVRFSKTAIPNPPEASAQTRRGLPLRTFTILDMAYLDGQVYLSGLSNEEFSSRLRRLPYPFNDQVEDNSLEIFHTAHGRYETHAPINAFAPYQEDGQTKILGAFSCTPLVSFPIHQANRAHVKGKTVAELGAGNHPLDIISYTYDGNDHFLLANHLHGFMKIDQEKIRGAKNLTRPTGRAGTSPKVLSQHDIIRVADLNAEYVTVIQRTDEAIHLLSLPKKSL